MGFAKRMELDSCVDWPLQASGIDFDALKVPEIVHSCRGRNAAYFAIELGIDIVIHVIA
jgi:hypothetical protein